jgi:hypothetical protein
LTWAPRPERSTVTGKTLPDHVDPFLKHIKSGVKTPVVKMKYVTDDDHPKKPVMVLKVSENPLSRASDEDTKAR